AWNDTSDGSPLSARILVSAPLALQRCEAALSASHTAGQCGGVSSTMRTASLRVPVLRVGHRIGTGIASGGNRLQARQIVGPAGRVAVPILLADEVAMDQAQHG